ncbi:PrsW family glutamic-type intramembrane protease [Gulosibacter chungangensis]|uniref:PrsW family intramembrane metalloprotease n=1 Tax=Gulosibacter chungangensis TaxID=979746 RepID=A0A7J5BG48_9MICO|nr:PrsW family glutamic-type intramembrane protease [Gulosibacter chungangensis]KAB1645261.1 PrsW family intramembrane metalloprotease [Gulosibacter chungangensis]
MATKTTYHGGRAILAIVLLILVGAGLAAWGSYLLHAATAGDKSVLPADDVLPMLLVIAGALVGVGGAILVVLLYSGARIRISQVPHHGQALLIGLGWGVVATVLALLIETASKHLPGFWGTSTGTLALAGPIEEAMKLLFPVLLLAFGSRFRDPKLGFWMVMAAGAMLGLLEGLGYVIHDVLQFLKPEVSAGLHAVVGAVGTVNRAIIEPLHPIVTAGAAAMIWLAATKYSRGKAIGMGIAAYVGAAALHSFNDAVIAAELGKVNTYLSLVAAAIFIVLVYAFWLRPQYSRLEVPSPVGAPVSS